MGGEKWVNQHIASVDINSASEVFLIFYFLAKS